MFVSSAKAIIDNRVCSLKNAINLFHCGHIIDTLHYYCQGSNKNALYVKYLPENSERKYPAPMASELFDALPSEIKFNNRTYDLEVVKAEEMDGTYYNAEYVNDADEILVIDGREVCGYDKNVSDALALLLAATPMENQAA